ncbi:MAG TPA: hypothetical protein VGH39_00315 [Xanthobacteraceae bacterium]|jgi:hypothetical protein
MTAAAVLRRQIACTCAALLAAFVVVLPEPAQAQVPTLNIQETCRAAAGVMTNLAIGGTGGANEVEICLDSENKAREQLIKDWSSFQPADREGCIQTRVYLPSYIEWLTCFEMNKIVREAREQGRAVKSLTNADGSMAMPPLGSLGIYIGPISHRYGY